jgi:hypothetical protein
MQPARVEFRGLNVWLRVGGAGLKIESQEKETNLGFRVQDYSGEAEMTFHRS